MKLDMTKLPKSVHITREQGRTVFVYLDERLLPGEVRMEETTDWAQVIDAIKTLAVRGAPAIGVAGAAAVALWCDAQAANAGAVHDARADVAYRTAFEEACELIASARPTAVNLRWAVSNVQAELAQALDAGAALKDIAQAALDCAARMEEEDERINRAIGSHGAQLIAADSTILTHCNAGSLATAFYGTALGVVYAAAEQGKIARVYADETRPVGQGARLTVWELSRVGIPTTLICDNMAASVMRAGKIDAVIVGADRIAKNGDTANKIGTYGVAVLAHEHGIPFYVAAPFSTIDASLEDGSGIPIEQRALEEVLPAPIDGVDVFNPAFDVTPARYIAGIITERGVFTPAELHDYLSGENA